MDKALWDRAGDVGGLEGLIRSSSHLGCPEKKKRKSTVQGSMLPPLSEYAPPTITSSDHLIACNPFDDGHSISPLSGYTYFGKPRHTNTEVFNAFKMPPNTSPKRFRNGGSHSFRDQPLSFPKEMRSMPMERTFAFSNIQEKSPFENEIFFSSGLGQTITMPGQHFRPNHDQDVFHLTSPNSDQRNNFQALNYRAQSGKVHFIQQHDGSHQFEPEQAHFMLPKISIYRQDSDSSSNKNCNLNLTATEDNARPRDFNHVTTDPLDSKKHMHNSENLESETIDLTNSGPGNGAHSKTSLPKLAKSGVTPSEKCNRWLLQSSFSGPLSTDTMNPCGICSIEVNDAGDAIMCEVLCRKWFHRACTGMSEIAYALLTAEPSAIWGCDTCMAKKGVQLVCTRK
ncbi:dynein axonemal assembly factor 4 isoform 4-T4 [Anomaloglossus baeobatrachus]|uniref:pygopus homolog 1 n=1 Tax=Anomaloglossus baeobatrachus TaxID=238106 RepID=UPI003F5077D2